MSFSLKEYIRDLEKEDEEPRKLQKVLSDTSFLLFVCVGGWAMLGSLTSFSMLHSG